MLHTLDVHKARTPVNVDCVEQFADNPYVPDVETTGEALSRLRIRSGLSMAKLARAAGYSHASGIQRYVASDFDKRLPVEVAEKFADALAGHGNPPIERDEVFKLAGLPSAPNAKTFRMEGASEARMTRDVPIYGTALGADEIYDGEAVEQTMLNTAEVIGYLHRPTLLNGRADVYGIYVQGSSMNPRHRDGATLFVESRKRPSIGDDAVIYLRVPDEQDGERPSCVLIKTLVRKSASFIELEQYNPHLVFRIPTERVARMDRVITLDELVA
jgi:phage repressor protein C with HTH and peptisase S24 domain